MNLPTSVLAPTYIILQHAEIAMAKWWSSTNWILLPSRVAARHELGHTIFNVNLHARFGVNRSRFEHPTDLPHEHSLIYRAAHELFADAVDLAAAEGDTTGTEQFLRDKIQSIPESTPFEFSMLMLGVSEDRKLMLHHDLYSRSFKVRKLVSEWTDSPKYNNRHNYFGPARYFIGRIAAVSPERKFELLGPLNEVLLNLLESRGDNPNHSQVKADNSYVIDQLFGVLKSSGLWEQELEAVQNFPD